MTPSKIYDVMQEQLKAATAAKMKRDLEARGLKPIQETAEEFRNRQIQSTFASYCIPGCEICGGTGYVKVVKGYDTRLDPCPNYRKSMIDAAVSGGQSIGGLYADEIKSLNWNCVLPDASDGIKALQPVRNACQLGYGMGLLYGTYGQAKTLLMKIAVVDAIRNGKRAHYVKLTTLLDDIRLAYDEEEHKMASLLDRIEEWNNLDLLCLDEFDKSAKTEWALDRFFNLIDDRYQMAVRQKSITLLAANFNNSQKIPETLGYLMSRIEDNRFSITDADGKPASFVIYLNGPDGRKSMPAGRMF